MEFHRWVGIAGKVMEGAGVLVLVLGSVFAIGDAAARLPRMGRAEAYRALRQSLGRAILLGLELLVAADIIRTITERPSLEEVVALGLIVMIRTFLSFALELELEGRWPWQRRAEKAAEHLAASPVPAE